MYNWVFSFYCSTVTIDSLKLELNQTLGRNYFKEKTNALLALHTTIGIREEDGSDRVAYMIEETYFTLSCVP